MTPRYKQWPPLLYKSVSYGGISDTGLLQVYWLSVSWQILTYAWHTQHTHANTHSYMRRFWDGFCEMTSHTLLNDTTPSSYLKCVCVCVVYVNTWLKLLDLSTQYSINSSYHLCKMTSKNLFIFYVTEIIHSSTNSWHHPLILGWQRSSLCFCIS